MLVYINLYSKNEPFSQKNECAHLMSEAKMMLYLCVILGVELIFTFIRYKASDGFCKAYPLL